MGLKKRKGDKKANRMAMIIAISVHALIAIIFWNAGGDVIIKDIVMDIVEGTPAPPPPPPKPKMRQLEMNKPADFKPQFAVRTQLKVDPEFTPNFKTLATFDADVSTPDFTSMAKTYDTKVFNLDKAYTQNVTTDIMNVIGIGDLMSDKRGTKVTGTGKRMRARLNLCVASTPGTTELQYRGTVKWDYVFISMKSIDRARIWLKENTQIQVTENTITLNLENDFEDWVDKVRTKGALAVDSSSYYHENTALKRLENAIERIERNRISGKREFVSLVNSTVYGYLKKKYELQDIELLTPDAIIKKIEDRFLLREWRKRGIQAALATAKSLKDDWPEDKLISSIKPAYIFFKNALALENPLVIIANIVGLDKMSAENLDVLRTYVKNGGFIWIDDTGIADQNVQNQDEVARGFIHTVMDFDEKVPLSDREQETYNKLAKDDRNVQGYNLGEPFPMQAHPQAFIPITLPIDAPVEVRIYNRLGIIVKQFIWTKENPMKAGMYNQKEKALVWNCDNNAGEPVESGNYFVQMQSSLFQKTRIARVSKLRMLDEKHPLMSVVHAFRNVPVCQIDNGNQYWKTRPYGNAAFGYYYQGRMIMLYTEGAGVIRGLGNLSNAVMKDRASKFLNNVIAFCLSDEDGVAIKP